MTDLTMLKNVLHNYFGKRIAHGQKNAQKLLDIKEKMLFFKICMSLGFSVNFFFKEDRFVAEIRVLPELRK